MMDTNKPTNLAEILNRLILNPMDESTPESRERATKEVLTVAEAIAAIEELVPGKIEPQFADHVYRSHFIQGYNQAIDTIHHNFKGENND